LHRVGELIERRSCVAQAQDLGVQREYKERARDKHAPDHGAGDVSQRHARFVTERGRAFKSDEAEDCGRDTESDARFTDAG